MAEPTDPSLPQRPSRSRRARLALVLVVAVLLSGCAGTGIGGPAEREDRISAFAVPTPGLAASSAATSTPSALSTDIGTSTSTPSTPAGTASGGCTDAAVPPGVMRSSVPDLDGDGLRDLEWAELLEGGTVHFGVVTSRGVRADGSQQFAGGGGRSFVAGRLADGQVIALAGEGRATTVWTLVGCRLVPADGEYDGRTAEGDGRFFVSSTSNGGSAGCVDGHLAGFETRSAGSGRLTVLARPIEVSSDGRTATTGRPRVLLRSTADRTPADIDRLRRYLVGVSCPPSPTLQPVAHPR